MSVHRSGNTVTWTGPIRAGEAWRSLAKTANCNDGGAGESRFIPTWMIQIPGEFEIF